MNILEMLKSAFVHSTTSFDWFQNEVAVFAAVLGQTIRVSTKMVLEDINGLVLKPLNSPVVSGKLILPMLVEYATSKGVDTLDLINRHFHVRVVESSKVTGIDEFVIVATGVKGIKGSLILRPKTKHGSRLFGLIHSNPHYAGFRANGYNANVEYSEYSTYVLHSLLSKVFKDVVDVFSDKHFNKSIMALAQINRSVAAGPVMRPVKYIVCDYIADGTSFMVSKGSIGDLVANLLVNKPIKLAGYATINNRITSITKNVANVILLNSNFGLGRFIDPYNLGEALPKLDTFLGRELTDDEISEYKAGIDAGYDVVFTNKDIFKDINTGNTLVSTKIKSKLRDGILYGKHCRVNVSSGINIVDGFSRGSANNHLPWMLSTLAYRSNTKLKGLYVNCITSLANNDGSGEYRIYIAKSTFSKYKKYMSHTMAIGRSPSTGDIVYAKLVIVEDSKAIAPIYFSANIMPVLNGDHDGDGILLLALDFGLPKSLVNTKTSPLGNSPTVIGTSKMELPANVGTLYNELVNNSLIREYFNDVKYSVSGDIYTLESSEIQYILNQIVELQSEIDSISGELKSSNNDSDTERLEVERLNLYMILDHYKSMSKTPKVRKMNWQQFVCIMNTSLTDNGLPFNGVISPSATLGNVPNIVEYLNTTSFDDLDLGQSIDECMNSLKELFISEIFNYETWEVEYATRKEFDILNSKIYGTTDIFERNVILHKFVGTTMVGILANCDFHFGQLIAKTQGVDGCVLLSKYLIQEVSIQMQKKIQPLGKFNVALKYALAMNSTISNMVTNDGLVKWSDLGKHPEEAIKIDQSNMAVSYLKDNYIDTLNEILVMFNKAKLYWNGIEGTTFFTPSEYKVESVLDKHIEMFNRILNNIVSGLFLYSPIDDVTGEGGVAPGYHGEMIKFITGLFVVESNDQLEQIVHDHPNPDFAIDVLKRLSYEYLGSGASNDTRDFAEAKSVLSFICWLLSSSDRIATMAIITDRMDILGELNLGKDVPNWNFSFHKLPYMSTMADWFEIKLNAIYGAQYAHVRDVLLYNEDGSFNMSYTNMVKTAKAVYGTEAHTFTNTKGNLVAVKHDGAGNIKLKANNPKDLSLNLGCGEYVFANGVTSEAEYREIIELANNSIRNINMILNNRIYSDIVSDFISDETILEAVASGYVPAYDSNVTVEGEVNSQFNWVIAERVAQDGGL